MINQEVVGSKLPAYADIIHKVFDFSGGLNTHNAGLFLGDEDLYALRSNQFTLGINVIRSKNGLLRTRPGRVKVNSTPVTPPSGDATIRSMYELRRSDGTQQICMNAGNTFYKLVGSTWTSVGTFATANLRRCYTQFKEVLLGVDGTNDMMKYDGTTLSAIAAAPKGKAMTSHRNRVWIVKDKTLYYSANGDETDWTTPNNAGSLAVPISKGLGGAALIALWDRLIILCSEQVFQLSGTGPSDFALTPINMVYGHTWSCYGALAAGNDIYFADGKGAHAMSVTDNQALLGDVSYNYASGIIESEWQKISAGNQPNAFAVHDKKNNLAIFVHSTTSNNNDSAFVADYYHLDDRGMPTWTQYSNMPFACAAEVESLTGTSDVLFGDYTGTVYRQSILVGLDDTANIPVAFQYTTDLGLPEFTKLLRHVLFFTEAQSGTVIVSVSFDFGAHIISQSFNAEITSQAAIGSSWILGTSGLGSSRFKQTRVSVPGHGRFVLMTVTYSGDSIFTLGGFLMFAGSRRLISF